MLCGNGHVLHKTITVTERWGRLEAVTVHNGSQGFSQSGPCYHLIIKGGHFLYGKNMAPKEKLGVEIRKPANIVQGLIF